MSAKFPIWFLGLLLILTATATTQYFQYSMMGLTVFVLAYLTKGIRRQKKSLK
ncbi:hypothetical protein CWATWH8502_2447 [Crocosphaera watsonii WH 8502]|nr:hypothetical protein CWATWH0003_2650 [Crocosphaera watsonii WH 0003]CCQ49229.1 hypothetical protein CWATWH8502_2447 [Crocosphaera watsonii WH 8502]CCQ64579.1 hypothetical protein CWATWH0401_4948 [Crocosphaera watsonii WH 0401]